MFALQCNSHVSICIYFCRLLSVWHMYYRNIYDERGLDVVIACLYDDIICYCNVYLRYNQGIRQSKRESLLFVCLSQLQVTGPEVQEQQELKV